jgi:hypothetical protein
VQLERFVIPIKVHNGRDMDVVENYKPKDDVIENTPGSQTIIN